jgi:hypothetical protein
MSASGVFYEVHDSFTSPNYPIDCRVNYTYGSQTLSLVVPVNRDDLPATYTHADLATACANILGFPVSVGTLPEPP